MNNDSGLYFHIPFCANKCPYCAFYSVKYCEDLAKKYVDKLIDEMNNYSGTFDTIYFGGGTPSILPPQEIVRIINSAKQHFIIKEDCEITVECNPSKNLKEDFKIYQSAGVNRISLGMQSAVNQERFALGRKASKDDVATTISYAKNAGINNISLDLMLGTPKQNINSVDETFEFIEKMNITHISAYILKIEEDTKFFNMQNKLILPNEDEVCDIYLKTVDKLKSIGLYQYEISNFAKPNYESRHNTKYWQLVPYLGIGSSAHSFYGGKRFYYDNDFIKKSEGIGGTTEEKIMLGLRLTKGIDKNLVKNKYEKFVKMNLMEENESNVFLTPKGMLVSNSIISELI